MKYQKKLILKFQFLKIQKLNLKQLKIRNFLLKILRFQNGKIWIVLYVQNKIRNNKQLPEELRKIQLINHEELDQIRKIWFYDKLETEDMLPKICEAEAKGEYNFEPLEDSHVFDHDILQILKETCGDDEMIFEIARSLLEVERKHFKSNRRTGLFDEFENIFRKSFYKDKTDAIVYGKQKKKIKI